MTLIEKAKNRFKQMLDDFGSDPYCLGSHMPEMERWAHYMLKRFPEADREVVLLSVWLHDVGHYPVPTEIDHAVRGVDRSREFLENEGLVDGKLEKVLHCVRAHRCRDVKPTTIEAKIIAFIDSASHMTDKNIYLDMVRVYNSYEKILGKLERDYRDLELFPEIKKELEELYIAWKHILLEHQKADRRLKESEDV
ncbi:HD domain-containing protein [Candidatus Woesearchaeota archaeon]|nr:HD domain-containing protein [Candidatus Woesearchaeota archaeon]